MPCDCGPDERELWEKVRDQMKHHDETYDRLSKDIKERDGRIADLELELHALRRLLAKSGNS